MGSIGNSLSSTSSSNSTSSSSSSSNPTGIFTGTSAYSKDFQNVIDRAVSIASLPINLLTNQQTALNSQSGELGTLDTLFTKLQTAVQGIDSAVGGSSFQADYSNADIVGATLADGATEGIYSINVDNIGASAATLSARTWNATPAPGGAKSTYTLVVGASEYTITPADNSAQTVAAAINSQHGDLVHATAVNVGSAAAPDYRISLQSTTLGPMNLDLVQPATGATTDTLQGASAPASVTSATWDPAGGSFSLVVDGFASPINTSDKSAQGVAAAINAQYGTLVQATAVNQGTSAKPDYRIALERTTPGASALDIRNTSGKSLQQQGSAASYSTSETAAAWNGTPDPTGSRSMYTLVVGANKYSFTPPDNSAASVAATINAQFGGSVQATAVNLGTSDSPNYRICLRSTSLGSAALNIQRTVAVSYQKSQTMGVLARYEVDGGAPVDSTTRSIEVSKGVTLDLQGTGATDVIVSRSTSALSSALSSFADTYNAVVDELSKPKGPSAGPLAGQAILSSLYQTLSNVATYFSSSGQVNGLASLGLDLGQNGRFTYNAFGLMGADLANSAGVTAFLGSAGGGGFLQAASNALDNLEDPTAGLLKAAQTDMANQITDMGTRIATKQNQVYQLQAKLTSQMAAADALIASMEQQYSYFTNMFQAQQATDQMYK